MPSSEVDSNHSRKPSSSSRSNNGGGGSAHHPQKTAVRINVYDMSDSPRLARLAWSTGLGIYSSGVEVLGTEFSYGGDPYSDLSGVYTTTPRAPLSAGMKSPNSESNDEDVESQLLNQSSGRIYTCRASFLYGFTYMNQRQIITTVRKLASSSYRAEDFDQLTHNANNFTSDLVLRLTGRPAPPWLNRYFVWANRVPSCCLSCLCSPPPLVFPKPLTAQNGGSAASLHAQRHHSSRDAYSRIEDPTSALGESLSDFESSGAESDDDERGGDHSKKKNRLQTIDSLSSDLSEDSETELMGKTSSRKKTKKKSRKNRHR